MKKILFISLSAGLLCAQTRVNGSRVIQGTQNHCVDAGSNDTYTCSLPGLTAYISGALYSFDANTANTGAATINFSSLGAKTIKKVAGGITTDLADNDIRAGQFVLLQYDGTNMQIQSTLGNASAGGGGSLTSNAGDSPWVPWSWPGFLGTTAMVANSTYLWAHEREVSAQYRQFCLPVETGAASKVGVAAVYTRASNGDLTRIAISDTFSVATTNIGCGNWNSGTAVSSGVLTVPAAQNLWVAVCSDGAPSILRGATRFDLHLNGWNGGAFTRKLLGYSATACTGSGVSTTIASSIANADYTHANASSGHLSGYTVQYYFLP